MYYFLSYLLENSITNQSSCSPGIRLYIRCENIGDLPQDITINIEQLEKTYLSETIQEICVMYIDIPRFNSDTGSRRRLAAIIVSQVNEMTVLEELETTSKLKQLHDYQIPWAVVVQTESLHMDKKFQLTLLENVDRKSLEHPISNKK